MILYCVTFPVSEFEEDSVKIQSWFASRTKALKEAREFVRDHDDDELRSNEITVERYVVADLPPRKLLLAVLNQRAWVHEEAIVATYTLRPARKNCVECGDSVPVAQLSVSLLCTGCLT